MAAGAIFVGVGRFLLQEAGVEALKHAAREFGKRVGKGAPVTAAAGEDARIARLEARVADLERGLADAAVAVTQAAERLQRLVFGLVGVAGAGLVLGTTGIVLAIVV